MAKKAFGWTSRVVACLGVAGGLLAWGLTTRPMLLGLDWDSAFHLWEIDRLLTRGRDGCGLGNTLWTCGYTAHMALEPLYGLAAGAARPLSGDPLDGLRMVN